MKWFSNYLITYKNTMLEPILNKVLYKYREIELLQEEINELWRDAQRVHDNYQWSDKYYKEELDLYMENIKSYMI